MTSLTQSPAWLALAGHARDLAPRHLRELFANDPRRAQRFTLEFDEICLDYLKQRITEQTMSLLLARARRR